MKEPARTPPPPPPAGFHPRLSAPPPALPSDLPPLPAIDWASIGRVASEPVQVSGIGPDDPLPGADSVIMTWTDAEWAALDHVFCASESPLPNRESSTGSDAPWRRSWEPFRRGWDAIAPSLPAKAPSRIAKAWGSWRMVRFPDTGRTALLFKSDMHLTTDGPAVPLRQLVTLLSEECRPEMLITTGTSGGARLGDPIGSVVLTPSARFRLTGSYANLPFNGKEFSARSAPDAEEVAKMSPLLFETPVDQQDLEDLAAQVQGYDLAQLENAAIEPGHIAPGARVTSDPALTDNAYAAATTDGAYDAYACLEMDDAVIAMICAGRGQEFAVVRNISDPVLNPGIPDDVLQHWSYLVYHTYGLYTSFNGALCAWSLVSS